jgi:hypothetical protein
MLGATLGTLLYFYNTGTVFETDTIRVQWQYSRRKQPAVRGADRGFRMHGIAGVMQAAKVLPGREEQSPDRVLACLQNGSET